MPVFTAVWFPFLLNSNNLNFSPSSCSHLNCRRSFIKSTKQVKEESLMKKLFHFHLFKKNRKLDESAESQLSARAKGTFPNQRLYKWSTWRDPGRRIWLKCVLTRSCGSRYHDEQHFVYAKMQSHLQSVWPYVQFPELLSACQDQIGSAAETWNNTRREMLTYYRID